MREAKRQEREQQRQVRLRQNAAMECERHDRLRARFEVQWTSATLVQVWWRGHRVRISWVYKKLHGNLYAKNREAIEPC